MRPFEYVSPNSRTQAISLLGTTWGNTEVLAGGTDLLALMKDDVVAPKRLVNIKDINDLRGVSSNAQGLRVGALTTLGEFADDENVKKNYPALSEALLEAASPQIRNMATIGGNLCQRPRCWYFRNGLGLLPKDEAGKELVAAGENRYHAIQIGFATWPRSAEICVSVRVAGISAMDWASCQKTKPEKNWWQPERTVITQFRSDSQHGHDRRKSVSASALLVFPQWTGPLAKRRSRKRIGGSRREPLSRNSRQSRSGQVRKPFDHSADPDCLRRQNSLRGTEGKTGASAGEILRNPQSRQRARTRSPAE